MYIKQKGGFFTFSLSLDSTMRLRWDSILPTYIFPFSLKYLVLAYLLHIALTHAAKEAIWIQEFLGEVFPDFSFPTTILSDNQGTLALAVNPAFHAHTKHIRVCHHFIHNCVKAEDVDLEYVLTGNQVVDIFTKGLPSIKHKKFTSMMGLAEDYAHWVGMLEISRQGPVWIAY